MTFYEEGTYVDHSRGSVLILVKNDLNPVQIQDEVNAEIRWVSLRPHTDIEVIVGGSISSRS